MQLASFKLLAGEDNLTRYLFNTMQNEHWFCRTCGVRPYGVGHLPDGSRIYGVNIGCLEGVSPEVLAAAPVIYVDGLHDVLTPPAITSYL